VQGGSTPLTPPLTNTALSASTLDVESYVERSSSRVFGGDLAVVDAGVLATHALNDQFPLGHAVSAAAAAVRAGGRMHSLHHVDTGVRREHVATDRQRMRLVLAFPRHLRTKQSSMADFALGAQPTTNKIWLESTKYSFGCCALAAYEYTRRTTETTVCENMTSSTKPEVHNVSQHHRMRTEPQATCTEFGVRSCGRFSRYEIGLTHRYSYHNTLHTAQG